MVEIRALLELEEEERLQAELDAKARNGVQSAKALPR